MLSLALLGVAALPTVTASGAFFTDQVSQTGNTAAAATLGAVSTFTAAPSAAVAGPPAVAAGSKTDLSWASATGQAWATSNSVSSGVTYTVKRSETADFTNGTTVYEGANTTFTDTGSLPALRPKTISVAPTVACGLSTAGTAYCWGDNNAGQLGIGATSASSVPPVKVDTSGVLKDKTLTSVSTGLFGACVLDSAGLAYCWGSNNVGQLGDGTTTSSPSPVAVSTSGVLAGKKLVSLSTGLYTTCALDTKGAAYCWGSGNAGRLGYAAPGGLAYSNVPGAVRTDKALAGKVLTDIAVGNDLGSVCALDSMGVAYCWGSSASGSLGNDTTSVTTDPVPVTMPAGVQFQQINGAGETMCALSTGGAAYCWGKNNYRQTGTVGGNVLKPALVSDPASGAVTYKTIKSGGEATCGIAADDTLYCWGRNYWGQLGNGTQTPSADPGTAVPTPSIPAAGNPLLGKKLAEISLSYGAVTCGTDTDGTAYCWGQSSRTMGNSAAGFVNPTPLVVQFSTEALAWKSMDMGSDAGGACGITTGNRVYCWGGTNAAGQLGNGTTTAATRPVPVDTTGVLAGKTMTAVSVGANHACALDSDGIAYCWGSNALGALGDGTTKSSSSVPVRVKTSGALGGVKITSIGAMDSGNCALTTGGKVFCWGPTFNGQTGAVVPVTNPATTVFYEPTLANMGGVLSSRTFIKLSVSTNSACAIETTSTVYCWGYNLNGNLGNGTRTDVVTPAAMSLGASGSTFRDISVGPFTTCMLNQSSQAFCLGLRSGGSLGTGSSATNEYVLAPVLVSGGRTYSAIYTGSSGACALATSGSVPYCWGTNNYGQVGNNSTANALNPVAVTTSGTYTVAGVTGPSGLQGKTVSSLSVWGAYSYGENGRCAIATDNSMSCWGTNNNSTFGTPSATLSTSNVPWPTAQTSTTIAVTRTYARCPSGETPSATGTCGLDPAIAYNYQVGYKYYLWESPLKTAVRAATP